MLAHGVHRTRGTYEHRCTTMSGRTRRVVCRSGLKGWRCRLRKNYSSFEEFEAYNRSYNLAGRLGYKSAVTAWRYNPVVEGSTDPGDYRKVKA